MPEEVPATGLQEREEVPEGLVLMGGDAHVDDGGALRGRQVRGREDLDAVQRILADRHAPILPRDESRRKRIAGRRSGHAARAGPAG
jgi:hypothetical protein